ncbi:MAG: tRNA (guanosine(46)-N7)-methyltransferase TrmB [Candidatus Auribacter fodinae]|jgi:tRNA (guanine-N7-)-methyltransferase|uniref:tRNA (guanine-N(7)-)-methyltransferase n=1 Tax=Candidatus Auribacter fodinae TaxID=2093366 RepID=A0A3A4RIY8_9BACT|nr:MAG: tRNA (guanosine(46)-N7)-methyltransferase TrmB [Candidatus Auribacter fodinae]
MANALKTPEIIIKTFTQQLRMEDLFSRECPVWLEIGFGVGKFFLEQARNNPDKGLIGVENDPARYFKMRDKLSYIDIDNTRICRTEAEMLVKYLIPEKSIDYVFINFPDPWPKNRHTKFRLFTLDFSQDLARIMKHGARVRIVTDVKEYADHIRKVMLFEDHFIPVNNDTTSFPTTTFQDRFIKTNIPYYPQIFQSVNGIQ